MLYFSFIYLFSFIFWGRNLDRKKKILFAMVPFILISCFRFGYGADYFSYERLYHDANIGNFAQGLNKINNIEPLYILVTYLFGSIGISYHVFSAIFTLFISGLTIYWLVDYSPNFEWSVLLYFSMHYPMWTLSALRQGIAMILMFYFLFNNKKDFSTIKKSIVIVISLLFHTASIVVPVIYLVSKLKWNKKYFLAILLLVPIVRFLIKPEIIIYFENFPIVGKYISYFQGNQINLFGYTSLVRMFFFFVMIFHYDRLKEKHGEYTVLFNFVTLSFLLYFFLPFSTVIATRVTVYGYFLTIIVFPMIVELYTDVKLKEIPLRNVALIGLSLFSMMSFYNEFDKMKDRSGYIYSLTSLNFETIFNKNYDHFDKQFILHNQINEKSISDQNNLDIFEKVNSKNHVIEADYNPELEHYSVYFPSEEQYGIINEKGEIVVLPFSKSRSLVVGDIVEEVIQREEEFKYSVYRDIETNNIVTEENFNEQFLDLRLDENNRKTSIIRKRYMNFISFKSAPEGYNYLPIQNTYVHEDEYDRNVKYLEIRTSYHSYYLLISGEDEVLNDKWYSRIEPVGTDGLIYAHTEHGVDLLNRNGDIIWVEKYK